MVTDFGTCGGSEFTALVHALDSEFITSRDRSGSLASRFPHALNSTALAQIHVARLNGTVAACVVVRRFKWNTASDQFDGAMIGMVYTTPATRKQGLAATLLTSAIHRLRDERVDFAVLWSGLTGYYETRGWTPLDGGVSTVITNHRIRNDSPSSINIASNIVNIEHLRQTNHSPWIARSDQAWTATPLPAERVEAYTTQRAYVLCGRNATHTYVYEMLGDVRDFSLLWERVTANTPNVFLNAQRDSLTYRWLTQHTQATWHAQSLAFWQPLSSRVSLSDCANWYIPYFDRI